MNILQRLAIKFIDLYQDKLPDKQKIECFYSPSCSEYMKQSITKYGAVNGIKNGVARLKRCYEGCVGGEDYP